MIVNPQRAPVVLILFNRPEPTARVFGTIRRARPAKLFLIADGPRGDHPSDGPACAAARAVVEQVDWECQVVRDYSDHNLGCGKRIATGLDRVFEQVDEAIILEDDCLAEPSFFAYCDELLERYRDEPRVMAVSGDNFQSGRRRGAHSYYYSRYCHVWGWATWRRAWQHYDWEMRSWPQLRDERWLERFLPTRREVRYWTRIFERMYDQSWNTWDYRWTYACWRQQGLTILPNVNLVSNIGFGEDSTHTLHTDSAYAALPTQPMVFPMSHPPGILRDEPADEYTNRTMFARPRRARIALRLGNLRRKLTGRF